MHSWKQWFKVDPIAPLLKVDNSTLQFALQSDLLAGSDIDIAEVWTAKEAKLILKRQGPDGSWRYTSNRSSQWRLVDYDQYESVKQLAELVEKYRFTKKHTSIQQIAEYFFDFQTEAGDIRGIYGNQYSPNYTAMIIELLIKAGYNNDSRVKKALEWLLTTHQHDGGWALALRTRGLDLSAFSLSETIEPDYAKPSSTMITGVVLRALVAHPRYRKKPEVKRAGMLLANNIFTKDTYADRQRMEYWTKFGFPFVYTDIVSALDSLSIMGGFATHPKVNEATVWLAEHQLSNGLFDIRISRGAKDSSQLWMSVAICRAMKRIYG